MNTALLKEVVAASYSGKRNFPQIVGALLDDKIESYHVDLVRGESRFYTADGQTHVVAHDHKMASAAQEFSAESVNQAVRTVQAGKMTYPEFLKAMATAGCVYYIAYLAGKRVVYMGRKGESHTEHFPQKA